MAKTLMAKTLTDISRAPATCTCRGYDPADPCGHDDTSEGCPKHDLTSEFTCEHCGEPVVREDGQWLHNVEGGAMGRRCWPGRNFYATPEAF